MTFFSFFFFLCYLFIIIYSDETPKDEKPKENLSPKRLRAEGDAAFSNRNYKKALEYFNRLINIENNNHINYHKRALTQLLRGKYWQAIDDWSKSLQIDNAFESAMFYRGKTYKKLGKCDASLSDLNNLFAINPNYKDLNNIMSETIECVNNIDKILNKINKNINNECDNNIFYSLLDKLQQISPYNSELTLGLSQCNYIKGEYQMVLKHTGSLLRIDSQNLKALLIRGNAYRQLNEPDMALKHYKMGLRSDPDNKPLKTAFKKLKKLQRILSNGESEMNERKWKDAQESYEQSLTIDPENNHLLKYVYTMICKCSLRNRKTKLEDKIKLCDIATEKDNDSAEAYFYRGMAYKEAKKWDEAVTNFENAVNKDQGNNQYQQELRDARFEKKKANRKDYYGILKIEQHASEKDIKKGFRKCGLEHHPDRTKHLSEDEQAYHETMFKECVEAHDILTNPQLKEKYDRGEDVLEQMQGGNRGGDGFPFGGGFPFNFGGNGGGGFQQGGRTFTFRFN